MHILLFYPQACEFCASDELYKGLWAVEQWMTRLYDTKGTYAYIFYMLHMKLVYNDI